MQLVAAGRPDVRDGQWIDEHEPLTAGPLDQQDQRRGVVTVEIHAIDDQVDIVWRGRGAATQQAYAMASNNEHYDN